MQHAIFLIDLCQLLYVASLCNLCAFIVVSFTQTPRVLKNQEGKTHTFFAQGWEGIDLRVELNLKHLVLSYSSGNCEEGGVWTFCFSFLRIFVTKPGLWMEKEEKVIDFLKTESISLAMYLCVYREDGNI